MRPRPEGFVPSQEAPTFEYVLAHPEHYPVVEGYWTSKALKAHAPTLTPQPRLSCPSNSLQFSPTVSHQDIAADIDAELKATDPSASFSIPVLSKLCDVLAGNMHPSDLISVLAPQP